MKYFKITIRKTRISIFVLLFLLCFDGHLGALNNLALPSESNNLTQPIITVGIKGADINGSDNLAIQAAIDLLSFRGGGTVQILPGEYTLFNSIYLRSNIRLTGSKEETLLKRCPAVSSRLLIDADVGEKKITPADPSLFKVGMGIVCRSNNLMNAMVNTPVTIMDIKDGSLFVNGMLTFDFIATLDSHGKGGYDGLVTNIFPMIIGSQVENVIVEGLTINSFVADNPGWENVRMGGIYFRTAKNSVIRDVNISNTQGDGIFIDRASTNITIENCESSYNTYHGVHPGSHSTSVTVKNCNIHHNGSDGLYICWGIKNSYFLNNIIYNNGIRKVGKRNGISIGHKDTHNVIEGNHIFDNAVAGIYFREKTEANGAHHNVIRGNIIENNGLQGHSEHGYGIIISGITYDILIEKNIIRETRKGDSRLQKHGILIKTGVRDVRVADNEMSGHLENIIRE